MSLRDELLTPFRGAGEVGRDLWEGSKVLAGGVRRCACRLVVLARGVLWRGDTIHDQLESLGTGLLAGGVAVAVAGSAGAAVVYVAAPYAPWIAGGAVVGWVVAALLAAPPNEEHTTENDHEMLAGEQPTAQDLYDRVMSVVLGVLTDAVEAGLRGVHVADLLQALHDAELRAFGEVGPLRDWLEACGIPVRRNLKVRDRNTLGVHVDDVTAALGLPLREALAALAQPPAGEPQPGPADTPSAVEEEAPVEAAERPHLKAVPDLSPDAAA